MNEKIIKAIEKRVPDQWRKQFIENPERFIGPNYKAVINFWVFHDSLSGEQYSEVNIRWAKNNTRRKRKFERFLIGEVTNFYVDIDSLSGPTTIKYRYSYNSEQLCSNILTLMVDAPSEDEIDLLKIYEGL